jgi:uncharacterized membrane protein
MIFDWITWTMINSTIPFVGVLLSGIMMFSSKSCTSSKTTSTLVILFALIWLNLIWADFGSEVFAPSRQTMSARILLIIAMGFFMSDVRKNTKRIQQLKYEKATLKAYLRTQAPYK